ncbi:hypothetical protein [Aliarcobacter cibarius]|uniref:Uncharacterized protein n=1 Tax=Aliarcobacter cibarius TaxID=255507 RepID=A0A7L5JSK4_9BACT|nr:hypothetical protein [Aliarcobacter cibarius]QKJ28106.1 hypothetical protein ACBT_2226 [Aliarcobacter cibarius]TLT05254.1 hypothetical protein FE248_00755 [Aliarcobacter cibarius]
MKKLYLIFIFLSNIAFSLDLTNFEDRQKILQDIKSVILKEESIASAYEKYILDNYAIPDKIDSLYTSNYLGQSVDFLSDITDFSSNFNPFSISENKISYSLKLNDIQLKSLYESNTFRKKTYIRDNKLYFILEDGFAKHLYDLIKLNNGQIIICPNSIITVPINCRDNNHIYIGLTKKSDGTNFIPDKYLIIYHIDKFKTGPIIITNDILKYSTESAFNSIPKGALLYNANGVKHLKTVSGIEILK